MHRFEAELEIIDGNPYVLLPEAVLEDLFRQASRNKGPLPVRGSVNRRQYQQTLVRYSGSWRLYVNMKMLDDSPRRIGEVVVVEVTVDTSDRSIQPHPKLIAALAESERAKRVFDGLAPSRQKEIVRYIDNLKTEVSVDRNVRRAIQFLLGRERFVGRDRP